MNENDAELHIKQLGAAATSLVVAGGKQMLKDTGKAVLKGSVQIAMEEAIGGLWTPRAGTPAFYQASPAIQAKAIAKEVEELGLPKVQRMKIMKAISGQAASRAEAFKLIGKTPTGVRRKSYKKTGRRKKRTYRRKRRTKKKSRRKYY